VIVPNILFISILVLSISITATTIPQQQPPLILPNTEKPKICSTVDILMSLSVPNVSIKEYFCHSI